MKRARIAAVVVGATMLTGVSAVAAGGGLSGASPLSEGVTETVVMGADYPIYGTPQELAEKADEVVEGTVVSTTAEMRPLDIPLESDDPRLNPYAGTGHTPDAQEIAENSLPYTVSTLVVTDAFGSTTLKNGDKIEIAELGGLVDGVDYQLADIEEPLRMGDKGLFFLIHDESGRYFIVGLDQGRFAPRSEEQGARTWRNPRHALDEGTVAQLAETVTDHGE